jgi:hypothetical protein
MRDPTRPARAGSLALRRCALGTLAAVLLAGTPAAASTQGSAATVPARGAAAVPPRAVPGMPAQGVALEFPRGTGAALFRRGETVLVVFDSPDLRNPQALRHPALAGGVEVKKLPQGTVLAIPASLAPAIGLARGPSGWVLGPSRTAPASTETTTAEAAALGAGPGPAPAVVIGGVLPNRVVPLRDPESGLPLLVGTTREAGRGFVGGRRAPEYDLLRTELGVAVLARSESLQLQPLPDRFLLTGSVLSPLPLDTAALGPTASASMTRCLGLPDLPTDQLLLRLRSQSAQLAATEPLARAARRRDLAATMLALGMGHEAQAEMARAAAEDASGATVAGEGRTLAAAASLVAGRVEEAAAGLRADAALPGCDEQVLWRSLFLAQAGDAEAAVPGLRASLPLLLAYPPGLRDRLLPVLGEAFAQAGAWEPLRALLADESRKARLPLAAASLAEADGNTEAALAGYDALARGRDRKARSVALRRAVELRLRTGLIDAAAAARAYSASPVAWRGDTAERDARIRLAQLLAQSEDAAGALALLRQTAALFPDHAATARREAGRILRGALDTGSPLAAVAAFQAASDFLPPEDRDAAEARLAELLLELDLPARASALLGEAAERAGAGSAEPRAEIGAALAAHRLADNDPAGAQSALDATASPALPEALRARRTTLAAAIAERRGSAATAAAQPESGAEETRAATAEAALGRRDWAAAAQALGRHLDARLPAAPAPLGREQQEAALRLAGALVLAGDDAALAALRERVADRMREGPHAEAFARLVSARAAPRVAAAR